MRLSYRSCAGATPSRAILRATPSAAANTRRKLPPVKPRSSSADHPRLYSSAIYEVSVSGRKAVICRMKENVRVQGKSRRPQVRWGSSRCRRSRSQCQRCQRTPDEDTGNVWWGDVLRAAGHTCDMVNMVRDGLDVRTVWVCRHESGEKVDLRPKKIFKRNQSCRTLS